MLLSILSESADTDVRVYTNIVNKIVPPSIQVEYEFLDKLNIQGKNDLLVHLPTAISLLKTDFPNLEFIVVVVDGDKNNWNAQKKEIEEILKKGVNFFPRERIEIGVAVKTIEAWLLIDEVAMNQTLITPLTSTYGKSESIKKPKIEMKQIYGNYCKDAFNNSQRPLRYADFLFEISSKISINTLKSKSTSFNHFVDDLQLSLNNLVR